MVVEAGECRRGGHRLLEVGTGDGSSRGVRLVVVCPATTPTLWPVFEITVQTEFAAAHALSISGVREPIHGHNWRVTVTLSGRTLDSDGLLCDFHTVEDVLREIVGPWHNNNLNVLPPFGGRGGGLNPSAENVARHIADVLEDRLGAALGPLAWVSSVGVSEAPGCVATYRPDRA